VNERRATKKEEKEREESREKSEENEEIDTFKEIAFIFHLF